MLVCSLQIVTSYIGLDLCVDLTNESNGPSCRIVYAFVIDSFFYETIMKIKKLEVG